MSFPATSLDGLVLTFRGSQTSSSALVRSTAPVIVSFSNWLEFADQHVRFAAARIHDNDNVRFQAFLHHFSLV